MARDVEIEMGPNPDPSHSGAAAGESSYSIVFDL